VEEALPEDASAQAEALLGGRSAIAQDKAACVARAVALERRRVAATIKLLEEGNTIPFIARYRKELTGSLNEDELRRVERGLQRVDALEARRMRVALALHRREALTDPLRAALLQAAVLEEIEDLWAPFKSKKQTRAQLARERGLGPLAKLIEQVGGKSSWLAPEAVAASSVDEAKGIVSVKEALAGARDILAEKYAQSNDVKQRARAMLEPHASLSSRQRPGADADGQYKIYWNIDMPIRRVKPYQFLAVQRGEANGALKVGFEVSGEACDSFLKQLERKVQPHGAQGEGPWERELRAALSDAFKRLLRPSLEREWRRRLKELAEDDAFDTYRRNIHSKLLTPPLRLHPDWGDSSGDGPVVSVLGIDPAYRTGCKMALIASTGQVIATKVVYPHPPHIAASVPPVQAEQAAALLQELLEVGLQQSSASDAPHARLICSIGNGTASRETESWLRQHVGGTAGLPGRIAYCVVDEAGASVYSASPLAGKELPDMDVSMRGAVSIARRLLDPMAELVKIDPQSIGVGLYQHDVDHRRVVSELKAAVMDCVNSVGVDLNTASPSLLEHVAGLSAALARNIVEHRSARGPFASRAEVLAVKGVGPRAHHQAAGFLRVYGGSEPLDATPVHPESYEVAKRFMRTRESYGGHDIAALAVAWGVGAQTLSDIEAALAGTVKDPREAQPPPRIKAPGSGKRKSQGSGAVDAQESGITVDLLTPGLKLQGVVRNVVAFGAFVDIGVGHDSLLHVSQYPPTARGRADALSVNDNVEVWVQEATRSTGGGKGSAGKGADGPPSKDRWRVSLTAVEPSGLAKA